MLLMWVQQLIYCTIIWKFAWLEYKQALTQLQKRSFHSNLKLRHVCLVYDFEEMFLPIVELRLDELIVGEMFYNHDLGGGTGSITE